MDACVKPVVLKKNWPVSCCCEALSCFPKWHVVAKTLVSMHANRLMINNKFLKVDTSWNCW